MASRDKPNQSLSSPASAAGILPRSESGWVSLRTLILLRWMAIVGQLLAITVAQGYLDLHLPLVLCGLALAASVAVNLVQMFVFPANKRLSQSEAMLALIFDLCQLTFLIFLTGGLSNPFVLLVLAPVVISAGTLELSTTVIIGVLTVVLVTVAALFSHPLYLSDGSVLTIPPLFEFGFWVALVIGIAFIALYSFRVASETRSMADALFATQMALARAQKLTDLGGVVAAAAHELGTPLATIKLVSAEMMDELDDHPALRDDAALIRDQADRCRDILRSMGRAGKDDRHMHRAPLEAVLREAAEPHLARGKAIRFSLGGGHAASTDPLARQPEILRRPEVIHGLRNLIQNAVDFARSTVWIDADWTDERITIRISDDGDGYPVQVIGRIGDPFMRFRRAETDSRPGYEGMGLGLFIAKTLLEQSGARLGFSNGSDPFLNTDERPDRSGAVVEVVWPTSLLAPPADSALGENQPILS